MKYEVTLQECEFYTIEVDAVDAEEAEEKAWAVLANEGGQNYFVDSSTGHAEVEEIGESEAGEATGRNDR